MAAARVKASSQQPDTLLLLSGGIDSAFCLWQRVQAGLPTRTHHVDLDDSEGRCEVERGAVTRVLHWMENHGSGLIEHSSSAMSFRKMWVPYNFHAWAYWAGVVMAAPSGQAIDTVILPRHSDAFDNPEDAQESDRVYLGHVELIAKRKPRLAFPIAHMTKADVVKAMPKDLLALCWWCRRPNGKQPCHKCRTCKQVDPAL